jgi:hypothetical protein
VAAWGANGWASWRTVGTAEVGDAYEGEREITVHPNHGHIVGIYYDRGNGRVYTRRRDAGQELSPLMPPIRAGRRGRSWRPRARCSRSSKRLRGPKRESL